MSKERRQESARDVSTQKELSGRNIDQIGEKRHKATANRNTICALAVLQDWLSEKEMPTEKFCFGWQDTFVVEAQPTTESKGLLFHAAG